MLLVLNPQNYGTYADNLIGHTSGCARIALAKEISVWKGDIILVGKTDRDPANQVVNIVIGGLISTNSVIQIERYDAARIISVIKEQNTKSVRITGSSGHEQDEQITDLVALLNQTGIESIIGESLDRRLAQHRETVAA